MIIPLHIHKENCMALIDVDHTSGTPVLSTSYWWPKHYTILLAPVNDNQKDDLDEMIAMCLACLTNATMILNRITRTPRRR